MRYSIIFSSTALIASTLAAYVPSDPWTTLTPTGSAPTGATTDHTHKFGIQVKTVESSVAISSTVPETDSAVTASASAGAKRDDVVNQIGDGQIQQQTAQTASVVNQIGDGQIQQQTAQTASVVNQIGDGQIQQQTAAPETASVVNQIGDGQIQQQTAKPTPTASVVNQIGDGQIQQQTAQTASVVNQIGDGQIQQQTAAAETASVVNQIGDGQIQQQTSQTPTTATVASQINDGQQQQTDSAKASSDSDSTVPQSCVGDSSLGMQLNGSVLTDEKGRIGAIVANRQFQFDGPPPQAGSIYAAGWSITENGLLALGDQTIFYQCHSGDFYNLYDESIAEQCSAVHLSIVDLVEC